MSHSLKYLRSATLDFKDMGIRQSNFWQRLRIENKNDNFLGL